VAKLVVFGAGDIARLAHFYFSTDSEHEVVAFAVDSDYRQGESFLDLPLVPFDQVARLYPPGAYKMFVAMSYGKMNRGRAAKYVQAKELGYELATYISSRCSFLTTHPPGDNCFILEDNTVQPFVRIGNNVTLWSGNHIGHDSVIGDHCFISSHVVVSGHVRSGGVFVGVNATLRNSITIAEFTLIGAGALVMKDGTPSVYWAPAQRGSQNQRRRGCRPGVGQARADIRAGRQAPWIGTHAALPVVQAMADRHRLASARATGAGDHIGFIELSLDHPRDVLGLSAGPVISPGPLGTFDDAGVTSACLIEHDGCLYFYYTGWSLGASVPFYLNVGLARSDDGGLSFRKISAAPVLDRSSVDPYLTASPWVLVEQDVAREIVRHRMGRLPDRPGPSVSHQMRWSSDGLMGPSRHRLHRLQVAGRACLRSPVRRRDGDHTDVVSYRGSHYRIEYAESTDGIAWTYGPGSVLSVFRHRVGLRDGDVSADHPPTTACTCCTTGTGKPDGIDAERERDSLVMSPSFPSTVPRYGAGVQPSDRPLRRPSRPRRSVLAALRGVAGSADWLQKPS
jgi:sugar O-acyltransferase (sialic acid O-acetyltransferase NeuD family)